MAVSRNRLIPASRKRQGSEEFSSEGPACPGQLSPGQPVLIIIILADGSRIGDGTLVSAGRWKAQSVWLNDDAHDFFAAKAEVLAVAPHSHHRDSQAPCSSPSGSLCRSAQVDAKSSQRPGETSIG
jgi:hypothetical protein